MGPRNGLGSQGRGVSFRSFRSTASASSNGNASSVSPMPPVPVAVMMNTAPQPHAGGMRLPTLNERETLPTFGDLHDDGSFSVGASSTRSGLFHGGVVTKLEDPVVPDNNGDGSFRRHQDFPAELMCEQGDHVSPLPVLEKAKRDTKKKRRKLFSFLFKNKKNAEAASHALEEFTPQRKNTASSTDGTLPTILSSQNGSVAPQQAAGTPDTSSSDDELDDVSRAGGDDDADSLAPVRPDRRRRSSSQDSDGSLGSAVPSTEHRGSKRSSRKPTIERPSLAYRITPPDSGVGRGGRPRSHRREDRSGGDGTRTESSGELPTSVAPTTATRAPGEADDDDDVQTQKTSRQHNDDADDMSVASAAIIQFSPTAGVSKIRPIVTMVDDENEGDQGVMLSLPRKEMKKATMVDSITPTVCERTKSEGADLTPTNRQRTSSHHSKGSHRTRRASTSSIGSVSSLPAPGSVPTNAAGMPIPQPARRRSLSGLFRRRKSWGFDSQGHQLCEDDCSQSAISTKSGGVVSTRSGYSRRQGHQAANADGDFQVPPQDEAPRLPRRNSLRRLLDAMGDSASMLFGSRRSVHASKKHHQMEVGNDGEDDGSWMGSLRGDLTVTSESMGTSGRGTMYTSSMRGDDNCSVGGVSRLSETESTSESYHHDDGRVSHRGGKRSGSRKKGKKGGNPIQASPKDDGARRKRQMAADRGTSVPSLRRSETR